MNQAVLIGPTRAMKSPDTIPVTAHDVDFFLDPGTYAMSVRTQAWSNVSLQSADPLHPALITNKENKEFGLFQFKGSGLVTLKHLNFQFAGNKSVVAQTIAPSASLVMENIWQNQGCVFWGQGGKSVSLKSVISAGIPWKYYVCNFTHPLASFTMNNSALDRRVTVIHEGPYEAAIRLLQVGSGYLKGFSVDGVNKQPIQIRSGDKFGIEDVDVHQHAFGWMNDPNLPAPTSPIASITVIGGAMAVFPVIGSHLSKVTYSNTLIAGKPVNYSKNY